MRKTFCDRCGGECTHRTVHVTVAVAHTTAAGDTAAVDEYVPAELCGTCGDVAVAALPALRVADRYGQDSADMRYGQDIPAPARVALMP